MKEKEFVKIADAIKTAYPKFDALSNKQAIELWYGMLKDLSYETCSQALKKHIVTSPFPPTIADLRKVEVPPPDWGASWEKALKAVHRYGYIAPTEAMESLDPITRKVVERVGYLTMCNSENISVERAHFERIYKQVYDNEMELARLPEAQRNNVQMLREATLKLIGE